MRKKDEKEGWERKMRKKNERESAYEAKGSYNLVMATDDDLAAVQLPEV